MSPVKKLLPSVHVYNLIINSSKAACKQISTFASSFFSSIQNILYVQATNNYVFAIFSGLMIISISIYAFVSFQAITAKDEKTKDKVIIMLCITAIFCLIFCPLIIIPFLIQL